MLPNPTQIVIALSGFFIYWILKIIDTKLKSKEKNFYFTRFVYDEQLYMLIGLLCIYPAMAILPEITGVINTPNAVAFQSGFGGASFLRTFTSITQNIFKPKQN